MADNKLGDKDINEGIEAIIKSVRGELNDYRELGLISRDKERNEGYGEGEQKIRQKYAEMAAKNPDEFLKYVKVAQEDLADRAKLAPVMEEGKKGPNQGAYDAMVNDPDGNPQKLNLIDTITANKLVILNSQNMAGKLDEKEYNKQKASILGAERDDLTTKDITSLKGIDELIRKKADNEIDEDMRRKGAKPIEPKTEPDPITVDPAIKSRISENIKDPDALKKVVAAGKLANQVIAYNEMAQQKEGHDSNSSRAVGPLVSQGKGAQRGGIA